MSAPSGVDDTEIVADVVEALVAADLAARFTGVAAASLPSAFWCTSVVFLSALASGSEHLLRAASKSASVCFGSKTSILPPLSMICRTSLSVSRP